MKVNDGFITSAEIIWELTKIKPNNCVFIEDVDDDYCFEILEINNGKIKVRVSKMPF